MSDVTYLSFCDERPEVCENIAAALGKRDLHDCVADDWRRPLVDGALRAVFEYPSSVDVDRVLGLLRELGYGELVEPIYTVYMNRGAELKSEVMFTEFVKWVVPYMNQLVAAGRVGRETAALIATDACTRIFKARCSAEFFRSLIRG